METPKALNTLLTVIRWSFSERFRGTPTPFTPIFDMQKKKVVYGQLTAAALSTLAGMYMPGKLSIIHSIETNFLKPVLLSKCPLVVKGTVKEKDERFRTITLKCEIFNTDGVKVCKGKMRVGFLEDKET